uniref:Secreted protein n=1 Tax=Steinernema glaseri TaxID=37863 RepID=A0A1I7Z9B3_9BILA
MGDTFPIATSLITFIVCSPSFETYSRAYAVWNSSNGTGANLQGAVQLKTLTSSLSVKSLQAPQRAK